MTCKNNNHLFFPKESLSGKFTCELCGIKLSNDDISKLKRICDGCDKPLFPTWHECYCSVDCALEVFGNGTR